MASQLNPRNYLNDDLALHYIARICNRTSLTPVALNMCPVMTLLSEYDTFEGISYAAIISVIGYLLNIHMDIAYHATDALILKEAQTYVRDYAFALDAFTNVEVMINGLRCESHTSEVLYNLGTGILTPDGVNDIDMTDNVTTDEIHTPAPTHHDGPPPVVQFAIGDMPTPPREFYPPHD